MQWAPSSPATSAQEALRAAGGARRRDLASNLLAFCRVLRTAIPNVTPGRIIDACRSLEVIDLRVHEDFHSALRANLITSMEELPVFEALYALFWQPSQQGELPWLDPRRQQDDRQIRIDADLPGLRERVAQVATQLMQEMAETDRAGRSSDALAYSVDDVLVKKDFEDFTPSEMREMRQILAKLTPQLATALSRRTTSSFRGSNIDLRRSFRLSLRYGGDVMKLARRRRKVHKLHIALLCDVSGSMDRYSRFLLQFIYGLENEMAGVDAWVFSTRLTEITRFLKGNSYDDCVDYISNNVHDWSGGTTIGTCLREFAQGAGKRRVGRRTVVIIISDGWDRGDVAPLEQAMKQLRRQAHKIIWLNPLLGGAGYQPLCAGMRTALPYIDYFLPAHNLESLMRLTKSLRTLSKSLRG